MAIFNSYVKLPEGTTRSNCSRKCPYAVLGVSETATTAEIKRAAADRGCGEGLGVLTAAVRFWMKHDSIAIIVYR